MAPGPSVHEVPCSLVRHDITALHESESRVPEPEESCRCLTLERGRWSEEMGVYPIRNSSDRDLVT